MLMNLLQINLINLKLSLICFYVALYICKHIKFESWESTLSRTGQTGALSKREETAATPKIQQRHLLICYWVLPSQKLISQLEIILLTNENGFENFGAFWSTDFCNLLAKSQAILLANYKNQSPKNPQNVLNHFHCQTIKLLTENCFCSAHTIASQQIPISIN